MSPQVLAFVFYSIAECVQLHQQIGEGVRDMDHKFSQTVIGALSSERQFKGRQAERQRLLGQVSVQLNVATGPHFRRVQTDPAGP